MGQLLAGLRAFLRLSPLQQGLCVSLTILIAFWTATAMSGEGGTITWLGLISGIPVLLGLLVPSYGDLSTKLYPIRVLVFVLPVALLTLSGLYTIAGGRSQLVDIYAVCLLLSFLLMVGDPKLQEVTAEAISAMGRNIAKKNRSLYIIKFADEKAAAKVRAKALIAVPSTVIVVGGLLCILFFVGAHYDSSIGAGVLNGALGIIAACLTLACAIRGLLLAIQLTAFKPELQGGVREEWRWNSESGWTKIILGADPRQRDRRGGITGFRDDEGPLRVVHERDLHTRGWVDVLIGDPDYVPPPGNTPGMAEWVQVFDRQLNKYVYRQDIKGNPNIQPDRQPMPDESNLYGSSRRGTDEDLTQREKKATDSPDTSGLYGSSRRGTDDDLDRRGAVG